MKSRMSVKKTLALFVPFIAILLALAIAVPVLTCVTFKNSISRFLG